MILNLILAASIAFFAYLWKESCKENRKLASEHTSYNVQVKRLTHDLDNSKRELDRLLDRNSYIEGKLNTFTKENEMLGAKNNELLQLYSLSKEESNKIKFKMIELEESAKIKKKANPKMELKQKTTSAQPQEKINKRKIDLKKKK